MTLRQTCLHKPDHLLAFQGCLEPPVCARDSLRLLLVAMSLWHRGLLHMLIHATNALIQLISLTPLDRIHPPCRSKNLSLILSDM